jgi:hypothetical protein
MFAALAAQAVDHPPDFGNPQRDRSGLGPHDVVARIGAGGEPDASNAQNATVAGSMAMCPTAFSQTRRPPLVPATRHVPLGPQISCHALNSPGLIG